MRTYTGSTDLHRQYRIPVKYTCISGSRNVLNSKCMRIFRLEIFHIPNCTSSPGNLREYLILQFILSLTDHTRCII